MYESGEFGVGRELFLSSNSHCSTEYMSCDNFANMPYYDNFWQNIPSTCLTFFIKLKTENQLIRFEAASGKTWLGIQQSVIDH